MQCSAFQSSVNNLNKGTSYTLKNMFPSPLPLVRSYPDLAGPSGIRAGRVSNIKGRLEAERLQFRLGHLRVGELYHWHFCHPCIALDLVVQFKLCPGTRAWTQIWVHVQLGSSGPHCTKWVNDQYSQAELVPRFVSDLPLS